MIQGHRLREARKQRVLSQGALGKLVTKDGAYIFEDRAGGAGVREHDDPRAPGRRLGGEC